MKTTVQTLHKRILLVEDNSLYRNSVKLALEAAGYTVYEAEDGLRGLRMTEQEMPDLIFMDIYMPVLTGIELIDQLKKNRKIADIPIIILTNVEEEIPRSIKKGAYAAYLKVSLSPIQVVDICRAFFDKQLKLLENVKTDAAKLKQHKPPK